MCPPGHVVLSESSTILNLVAFDNNYVRYMAQLVPKEMYIVFEGIFSRSVLLYTTLTEIGPVCTPREKEKFVRWKKSNCTRARHARACTQQHQSPQLLLHMQAAAACQQESQQGDVVDRDACQALPIKQYLRALELLGHQVVPRLQLV
jgi:hypothetical protein